MFDEVRRAWRQAVENFWREIEGGDSPGRAVYREVGRVRSQLEDLDDANRSTRHRLAEELDHAAACARRERLARSIGDAETSRIAAEYRHRHQERADVLGQKLSALEAEKRLWVRDLEEMEKALQEGGGAGAAGARAELEDFARHPRENEFLNLEDAQRRRTAEERLEELRRRMNGRG